MTTVTTVGLAVLDLVFGVEKRPDRGRKVFASSLTEVGGGPAANAAVTIAALGGDARFIGRVGTDSIGDVILGDFDRWGVDRSRVRRITDVPSPVSSVVIEADGERTIVNYTDPRLHAPDDMVTGRDVEGADVVLADLRWPTGGLSALRSAAELGIPSVLDFDETPESGLATALTLPTYIVFSSPALAAVSETSDPTEGLVRIARETNAWLAVTLGARGTLWLDEGTAMHTPSYPIAAVDTLGAGDVYHGAFALGIADSRPIPDVVLRASATAALKCTRFGGRDGIPTRDEVDEFMEENPK
ncbi:MAG: PfkB family carbohydrate kinase [Actinomycetota bacterium]|nr:PfkB family carbohydrate kinase [Actinomycetota bacterium]